MRVLPPVPVLCDANVLFSEWQCALILTLAHYSFIDVYWTECILDECFRNLLRLQRLTAEGICHQRTQLQTYAPHACLAPQPQYVADVQCVQAKDRHVAAAALGLYHQLSSQNEQPAPVALWTWNIRDFPRRPLLRKGIVRYTPDEWLKTFFTHHGATGFAVLEEAASRLMQWRCALDKHLSNYQKKAPALPQNPSDWPVFLDRNGFKQAAKVLSQTLLLETQLAL